MTKRKEPWKEYVGKDVRIEWKNHKFDWPYFHVESASGSLATLLDIADPEIDEPFVEGSFNARFSEVKTIEPLPPPGDSSYFENVECGGVLDRAKRLVDGRDKQEHYGPPVEFMSRLASSWSAYLSKKLTEPLTPFDAAMLMASLKILRLGTNPNHEDSLIDLAGYVNIGEKTKAGTFTKGSSDGRID